MVAREERPAIPSEILAQLRRESGFGCPICRKPLLTYHHFDPPWTKIVKLCKSQSRKPTPKDHVAEGMIALCREHHDFADSGGYGRAYLRELKNQTYDVKTIGHQYPWVTRDMVVRLGGNYFTMSVVRLTFRGSEIVRLERGVDGLLLVSFRVSSRDGVAVSMEQNSFLADGRHLFDLECKPLQQVLRARYKPRLPALELSCKRITAEDLRNIIEKDREAVSETMSDFLSAVPAELRPAVGASWNSLTPWEHESKPGLKTATEIYAHATERCTDEEGMIAFLDFKSLLTFSLGHKLEIRDGIAASGVSIRFCHFKSETGAISIG